MVTLHRWETDPHAWDPPSGIMDGLGVLGDFGGEDVDPDDMSPEEQASEFEGMLLSLKSRNKLSAKDIAILFYWASRGRTAMGEGSKVWQLGRKPGLEHYSHHIDTVTQPRMLDKQYLCSRLPCLQQVRW